MASDAHWIERLGARAVARFVPAVGLRPWTPFEGKDREFRRHPWLLLIAAIVLVGCQFPGQDTSHVMTSEDSLLADRIEDYLVTNVGTSAFGGTVFCAYERLNAEQGTGGKIYVWALCQEYYLQGGSLSTGTGMSLPVALEIRQTEGGYEIVGHLEPRDGIYYGPDVRAIFPRSTWAQIMPEGKGDIDHYNNRSDKLEEATETEAKAHYGIGAP